LGSIAIRRYPNTVVINPLSVASIPEIGNNSVDRVLSLAGLHHLTAKQKQQFFFEAHRVLRPGGLIVVADVMQGYVKPARSLAACLPACCLTPVGLVARLLPTSSMMRSIG